jgi:hypothetical protein
MLSKQNNREAVSSSSVGSSAAEACTCCLVFGHLRLDGLDVARARARSQGCRAALMLLGRALPVGVVNQMPVVVA